MSAVPEIVRRYDRLLAETTEEELEVIAYDSPAVHFGLYMEIKDKNGKWVRPTPNVLQLRISETITTFRDRCPGVRIRIIGVKPRRAGLSTFSLHCGYHEAMRRPIEGITIADCKKNSNMLIERLGEFSGHDSFPWGIRVKRNVDGIYEWGNGSRWTIDTAENPDAGVGGTRHFGHFSECSKYPQTAVKNDVKTMTAALPSFSGSDTICVAESTPEGAQGWFHETFDDAMWLEDFLKRYDEGFRPEQQWIKVFAAWWEFDDYRRQSPVTEAEQAEIERTLSNIEREEREKYNLTYEQLAWRRETIAGECNGDPRIFAYYYPSDPVSCWIASGSPKFDQEKIAAMAKAAQHIEPATGYLVRQEHERKITWFSSSDGTGDIQVWEMPIEGCAYLVACDPATGRSQTVGKDPDRTSIGVWRQKYFDPDLQLWRPAKLVARVRPPFDGNDDVTAGHIDRLSAFYGRCIVGLEVNQGLQVLRCLLDAGVPMFQRPVFNHRINSNELQYGFKLNDDNQRRMVIDALAAAVRYEEIDILCRNTIKEMQKFVRKTSGRYEAASGAHDDDVMMAAMAWEVMSSATVYARKMVRNIDPPDMAKPGRKTGGWRQVSNVKRGW